MSRRISISALLLAPAVVLAVQGLGAQHEAPSVPNEILVQFRRDTSNVRRAAILAAERGRDIQRFEALDTLHVRFPGGRSVQPALASLRRNPKVASAQPEYVRTVVGSGSPLNDPLWLDAIKSVLLNRADRLQLGSGVAASGGRLDLLNAAIAISGAAPPPRVNVALASNGGTATASSTYSSGYAASGAINGDRRGQAWGADGGWNEATPNAWPDWLEVSFNGTKTLDEVDVFSVQDNYPAPIEPTPTMTFSLYGLRTFEVQYWTGSTWLPVPGGTTTNNTLVWRQFTFAPVATTKIRIWVTATPDGWSRLVEVEAYASAPDVLLPSAVTPSGITLRADFVGTLSAGGNPTVPHHRRFRHALAQAGWLALPLGRRCGSANPVDRLRASRCGPHGQ